MTQKPIRVHLNDGKLTLKAKNPPKEVVYLSDVACRGLVAICNPSGKVSFAVRTDVWKDGKRVKSIRRVIGTYPEMSVETARDRAEDELGLLKKVLPENDAANWTVAQAFAAHMERTSVGPKHRKDLRLYLSNYLKGFADKKLRDLTRAGLIKLHQDLSTSHPHTADKVMAAFRSAYNTALRRAEEGTLKPNPVSREFEFNRPGAQSEPNPIKAEDLPLWFKQVAALESPITRIIHELLIYTGMRPGDLMKVRREYIEGDTLVMPRKELPKAKKRPGPFRLPLTGRMLGLINEAIRYGDAVLPGTPYVIPGKSRNQPRKKWSDPSVAGGKRLRATHFSVALNIAKVPWHIAEMLQDRLPATMGRFYAGDSEASKREAQEAITKSLDEIRTRS